MILKFHIAPRKIIIFSLEFVSIG